MKYIITNFAYGTGPYLRTTELAIAFNDELEKAGKERMKIIVPLVYGVKQEKIMREEFGDFYKNHPEEIVLDQKLGDILKTIFYGGNSFEDSLTSWIKLFEKASQDAKNHLLAVYGNQIIVELNRSPRVLYDVAPAYFTSFGYLEEIFENALQVPDDKISISRDLLRQGIKVANRIEEKQKIHCITYPATFSSYADYKPRYKTEILVPPIMFPPKSNGDEIEKGIFVNVTGISGLDSLYSEVKNLGIKVYTNDPSAIPGSVKASPQIIANKNIVLQFARSGWSSVWTSMILGIPLIILDHDPKDDPEIYFNNLAIENLGIGIIYKGQSMDELLAKSENVKKDMLKVREHILQRWGTFDGIRYSAQIFAKDFLSKA